MRWLRERESVDEWSLEVLKSQVPKFFPTLLKSFPQLFVRLWFMLINNRIVNFGCISSKNFCIGGRFNLITENHLQLEKVVQAQPYLSTLPRPLICSFALCLPIQLFLSCHDRTGVLTILGTPYRYCNWHNRPSITSFWSRFFGWFFELFFWASYTVPSQYKLETFLLKV